MLALCNSAEQRLARDEQLTSDGGIEFRQGRITHHELQWQNLAREARAAFAISTYYFKTAGKWVFIKRNKKGGVVTK